MKSINKFFGYFTLLLAAFCLFGSSVSAQKDKIKNKEFCSNDNYYGDKVSFRELRESTISAGSLTVDGKRNGGVKVRGENRSDILIRACVQTWDTTDEAARAIAKNIRIETSGGSVRAEGVEEQSNSSVSYEILVPRSTNLDLTTYNGGIGINGVDGTIKFEATNGGVSLYDVAGDVKGRTKNGGVSVTLLGNSWKGSGLDVETTNGGVNLTMPETYAARIETGTVNGGFKSEIGALNVERTDRTRGVQFNTDLNGGGAPIRVVTKNGGIKINSLNNVKL